MRAKIFPICFMLMIIGLIAYADYHCLQQDGKKPAGFIKNEIEARLRQELEPERVFKSPCINLAFLGLDKTNKREKTLGSFRTDTIIIMHINLQDKKAYLLSIPRDTYVFIPVIQRMDKINHAFPYGGGETGKGFASLISTVENFLAINIDHYIGMDMEAIAPIVDAVGGVEVEVDLDYHKDDCHLVKGETQILNGKMAYHYVHFRYTAKGDIDRIERQQKFLQAFLNMAGHNLSMEKGVHIYTQFKPMIYTDMTIKQISSLMYYFMTLSTDAINSSAIKGNFMNLNGISYWNPNWQQKDAIVDEMF